MVTRGREHCHQWDCSNRELMSAGSIRRRQRSSDLRGVAATVAAASTMPPAASTARAASTSDAPVVITSSTSTTRLSRTTGPATRAPARFRIRSAADSPLWSAIRRTCANVRTHSTATPSRRSTCTATWASRSVGSCPRALTAAREDGTGTRSTGRPKTPSAAGSAPISPSPTLESASQGRPDGFGERHAQGQSESSPATLLICDDHGAHRPGIRSNRPGRRQPVRGRRRPRGPRRAEKQPVARRTDHTTHLPAPSTNLRQNQVEKRCNRSHTSTLPHRNTSREHQFRACG